MSSAQWQECLDYLRDELTQQEFNQWISPLQVDFKNNELLLWAPNQYVLDGVSNSYLPKILDHIKAKEKIDEPRVVLGVGAILQESLFEAKASEDSSLPIKQSSVLDKQELTRLEQKLEIRGYNSLNPLFNFDKFVVGKSNQFAVAAAEQVAKNPGKTYNPLLLYGGVGLGKTHLMQAIGNHMTRQDSSINSGQKCKVIYMHSERFVAEMVRALQKNTINEFKKYYRSVDALLIDDIQFLSGKDRSQEEFFHTFNALLEGQQQVILTSDRYPKELYGIEERLKSRFGSGLTIAVNPPELETRVAILMNKAEQLNFALKSDVAFFIAKKIRSNVRELEGALKRIIANAQFTGYDVCLDFARETLKDMIVTHDKLISIDNIMRTVADFYKIKVVDLMSKKRDRKISRPRQIAMAICKELTPCSLIAIGDSFGGKDHSTVLHACRAVKKLLDIDKDVRKDYYKLVSILST